MTDPYRVLGVPTTATDDEIKAAYRALAKKYHPDNYINNPLADLAEAKMREINEAYDQIQMERTARRQNAGARPGQNTDRGGYQYSGGGQYADIRRMIDQNRIVDAEELLDGIPDARRDAEWHYLKGVIYYKRGWLEEAMNCFVMANRLQPNNPEFQAALNRMMWQRNTAAPTGRPVGCSCTGCDFCTSLICADCCCECMGGDIIRCC